MLDDRAGPGTRSSSAESASAAALRREGWNVPKPERLPPRTLWPVAAALGIVLVLWGVVTTYLIAGVGVVLLGVAVLGWMGDLRREQ